MKRTPNPKRVYRMLEQGVSDAAIKRRAHISEGSLAAYKAHYTRGHRPKSRTLSREASASKLEHKTGTDNSVKARIIYLLERGTAYEKVYADKQLHGVAPGTINAYIAHWSRGSYKES